MRCRGSRQTGVEGEVVDRESLAAGALLRHPGDERGELGVVDAFEGPRYLLGHREVEGFAHLDHFEEGGGASS